MTTKVFPTGGMQLGAMQLSNTQIICGACCGQNDTFQMNLKPSPSIPHFATFHLPTSRGDFRPLKYPSVNYQRLLCLISLIRHVSCLIYSVNLTFRTRTHSSISVSGLPRLYFHTYLAFESIIRRSDACFLRKRSFPRIEHLGSRLILSRVKSHRIARRPQRPYNLTTILALSSIDLRKYWRLLPIVERTASAGARDAQIVHKQLASLTKQICICSQRKQQSNAEIQGDNTLTINGQEFKIKLSTLHALKE